MLFDGLRLVDRSVLSQSGADVSAEPHIFSKALHYLRTNATGTAVETVPGLLAGIRTISDAAYTIKPTDIGWMLLFTNSTGTLVTVPAESATAMPDLLTVALVQWGVGTVTIAGSSSVTVNSPDGATATRTQFSLLNLARISDDVWLLSGDHAADCCDYAYTDVPASTYTVTEDDSGKILRCTGSVVISVPVFADQMKRPTLLVIPPLSPDTLTFVPVNGSVMINGESSTVARTRSTNASGCTLMPWPETNAWGVS